MRTQDNGTENYGRQYERIGYARRQDNWITEEGREYERVEEEGTEDEG